MLKFRNNLSADLNCFFGKERFLVWKEVENTDTNAETSSQEIIDKELQTKLNLTLRTFRDFILNEIHPELARILHNVKDVLKNKNLPQDKKNDIVENIQFLENCVYKQEIPQQIPSELKTIEEKKEFIKENIFNYSKESIHEITNKFMGIFGNLLLFDSIIHDDIFSQYKENLSKSIDRLRIFNERILKIDENNLDQLFIENTTSDNTSPIEKELEKTVLLIQDVLQDVLFQNEPLGDFEKTFLAENTSFLKLQLDKKTINPEIKKEIEKVIAKVDNFFEQIKIRELCLAVNEINFYQTEDLSYLKKEEIETLIEVIRLYYNQAEKVLFVLKPEEQSLFLKNLKHLHNLTEAPDQTDTNSVNIPMTISNLIQTMRNNPVFSN